MSRFLFKYKTVKFHIYGRYLCEVIVIETIVQKASEVSTIKLHKKQAINSTQQFAHEL